MEEEDSDLLHNMYSLFFKEICKIVDLTPIKIRNYLRGSGDLFEVEDDCVSINFLSYYNYDFHVSCKII